MRHLLILAACAASAICVSCTSDSEGTSDEGALTQSLPGPFVHAPQLKLATSVKRALERDELNLYRIALGAGDQITIENTTTSGDLVPDFTLYADGTATVKSKSFVRTDTKLSKNYSLSGTTTYVLAVFGKNVSNSGTYEVRVTCTGGPCASGPTRPIADSVADLEGLFDDGKHDGEHVTSSTPLTMVKQYMSQDHGMDEEEFSFVQNATTIEADSMKAGTLKTEAAFTAVQNQIAIDLEILGRESETAAVQAKAAKLMNELVAAGASFGFDGFAQNFCAAPTTQLLVLDSTNKFVHGVDLSPCVE